MKWNARNSDLVHSFLGHAAVLALVFSIGWILPKHKDMRPIEFSVVEAPDDSLLDSPMDQPLARQKTTERPSLAPSTPPPVETSKKAVFGLNRNALTVDDADSENSAEVKMGNTLAKPQDEDLLDPSDPDRAPAVPVEEFLVSQMPRVKTEVRVPYPLEAKRAKISGAVVFDLLIDSKGRVRAARVLESPGYGLDTAAVSALKKMSFEPARIDGNPVAVRIRYVYRFVLED